MDTANRIERSIKVLKVILWVSVLMLVYIYSVLVVTLFEQPKKLIMIEDSVQGLIYVRSSKDTVEEVLLQAKIEVNEDDLISPSIDSSLSDYMTVSVLHQSIEVFDRDVYIEKIHETIYDATIPLFEEKEIVGQDGSYIETVKQITVQDHTKEEIIETKVNQELVNDQTVVAPMDVGSYFEGKLTAYGVDCVGCVGRSNGGYGGLATGVPVSKYGVQDSGRITIDIKGESFYVLAADPSIPFCSVFSIENHLIKDTSGNLLKDVKGIVLDRGGGINGAHMDLFKGTEIDYGDVNPDSYVIHGTKNDVMFKMTKLGSGSRSCYKSDQPWINE